jgi:hypothetical protein
VTTTAEFTLLLKSITRRQWAPPSTKSKVLSSTLENMDMKNPSSVPFFRYGVRITLNNVYEMLVSVSGGS